MARKKVKIAKIMNESTRKSCLRKRRAGLFKKAEELCVLCDVQIGIVVYSPDEAAAGPAVWPSQQEMEGVMARFFAMPETERARKGSTLVSYLMERLEKEEEKINKAKKKNDEKEMEEITWQISEGNMNVKGLVDANQLNGVSLLAADLVDRLHKRKQQIMTSSSSSSSPQNPADHPSAPPPPPPPRQHHHQASPAPVEEEAAAPFHGDIGDRDVRTLSIPTPMEQLMNDQWFMDTMAHHQDLHIGGGSDLGLPPEDAAGTSGGTKDKDLPDDLNSAWPHIYSP
ncbi:MADS-box transcription factor PHERES 2-like [Cornus florida]|uniref:MADS-box transcription factor PHERES 2-like n=1 Tax=Cornus florida TaxID=4283 RepID=UPI00289EF545|nr:MADS-box transcription factor PHERES 2-like [Cornus florida]